MLTRVDRKLQEEGGPDSGNALDPGPAAVGFGHGGDDRQAEPGALPGSRRIGLEEAVEDVLCLFRAEPRSVGQRRSSCTAAGCDVDAHVDRALWQACARARFAGGCPRLGAAGRRHLDEHAVRAASREIAATAGRQLLRRRRRRPRAAEARRAPWRAVFPGRAERAASRSSTSTDIRSASCSIRPRAGAFCRPPVSTHPCEATPRIP